MNPLTVISLAKDIYRIYQTEYEKNLHPEHLPQSVLILFKKFKKAYEAKDIQKLKDTISENFYSDLYGETKSAFITFMKYNFQVIEEYKLIPNIPLYGLNPYLTIEIFNICSWSDIEFSAVIDMKANLQLLGIQLPVLWDTGKLFCEAKSEGRYNYWRITKIERFKE